MTSFIRNKDQRRLSGRRIEKKNNTIFSRSFRNKLQKNIGVSYIEVNLLPIKNCMFIMQPINKCYIMLNITSLKFSQVCHNAAANQSQSAHKLNQTCYIDQRFPYPLIRRRKFLSFSYL